MFAVVMKSTFDKIEWHVEIVIAERCVLLWIKRFEQSGAGIAAEIAPDFVDFVEHEDWIFGLRTPNALNDLPRQRADVGAPMSANFRFIVHAAKRQAHELAAQRAGNRFAQRGLPYSGRSDEAKYWPLHRRLQPPNRQIIQNAVFHFFQIVVVRIQNFFGFGNVHFAAGGLRPRKNG